MSGIFSKALDGPSDSSFIGWLLGQDPAILVCIERAMLDSVSCCAASDTEAINKDLVLAIYEKLCDSLSDPESQSYARRLQSEYVLVGATLFDLSKAFLQSHRERLQALMRHFYERAPWLVTEIEGACDIFVDQLSQFLERYSTYRAPLLPSDRSNDRAGIVAGDLDSLVLDMEWQASMATSWLQLHEACPSSVSVLLQDKRCLLSLANAYDMTTDVVTRLTDGMLECLPGAKKRCQEASKQLKWLWAGLGYRMLSAVLCLHGETAYSNAALSEKGVIDLSVLMDMLDTMHTVGTVLVPFTNAPFLLDLEFRFGVRSMLARALLHVKGLDDAQTDYISMSIDQLVDMADPLYRDGLEALKRKVAHEQESVFASTDGQVAAGSSASHDVDYHNDDAAAIAQIKDMLPDLGIGFIRACLDHYGHSVEAVAVAIFENDLPQPLADMDRTAEHWARPSSGLDTSDSASEGSAPVKGVLESRRNVFDNDEFDIFRRNTLDWSRVHIGKASLPTGSDAPSDALKSRVVQIAQRIGEEDEYDDTYDDLMQDSAVDESDVDKYAMEEDDFKHKTHAPGAASRTASAPASASASASASVSVPDADPTCQWEALLVGQYISDPSVLERKKGVRKLPAREALRAKTGLSDEQLEGWLTMFLRNPRKQNVLFKYGWSGEQRKVESAGKPSESVQGGTSNPGSDKGRHGSAQNHRHKEKNKAKVANHNRKKQQARKAQASLPQ